MVIVNNDEQAVLKGRAFMPADERVKIIEEFKCVDYVIKSIDTDRTVCNTLDSASKPHYFCNGGIKIIIQYLKVLYVKNEA